ncbi:MAG: DNA repair protein RecN [Thermodesulfobacteriota bacterium]
MLVQLSLTNYAIIDSLTVEFVNGLNIITGETGTGKSIIVDAINILLGDKVTSDIVKTGFDEATIEALFDINRNKELVKKIKEQGFNVNEGQLLIKRVISLGGRGKVFINGSLATLNILSDITGDIVDIFSQHEHQSLLKSNNHIKYLDSYSDNFPLFEEYKNSYFEYSYIKNKLEQAQTNTKDQTEKEEFLKYQLNELNNAKLQIGEDKELESEEKLLSNSEKISSALNNSYSSIYESELSAYNTIKNSSKEIKEISGMDPRLSSINDSINSILFELEEASFGLRDYFSNIESNPQRLEEINERLAEINDVKRKYSGTIEEILAKKVSISEELADLTDVDITVDQLKQKCEQGLNKINFLAKELSLNRKEASRDLIDFFAKEAEHVGLKGAMLDIQIEDKPVSSDGTDKISFLFSANPGENPKPLNKVASGGELSRIMLLLKELISNKEMGSILIFDEADSGIGGITAETIGKKIKTLSKNNQVICITHLPQVAKFANAHFRVSKSFEDDSTNVTIDRLSNNDRIEEISRMLSGENITMKTLEAAREMLSNA